MSKPFQRVKYACYASNLSMSVISALQPLLFVTFRSRYGISYSLLGTLVLVNFVTQLAVDLVFSFYSYKFSIDRAVRGTPVITAVGLFVYALSPFLFPNHVYIGLVLGTVIFSASGGLGEVLISRVIAAIPAENPDREMSRLHSVFAWGVVGVVLLSTALLFVISWQVLALFWMIVPVVSICLYHGQELPFMENSKENAGGGSLLKEKGVLLSVFCIFLGGASECTMSQWGSGYLEQALHIPKMYGDIFGVAMFSVMLGMGRSLYAKYGKNIGGVLFFGSAGAFLCYLTAVFSNSPVLGAAACALTGLCVSMLWPGNLIIASTRFASAGVAIFALMAAGGDLGASVAPQLVGIVADAVIQNEALVARAARLGLTADQAGMKIGLLTAAVFPLCSILTSLVVWRRQKKQGESA